MGLFLRKNCFQKEIINLSYSTVTFLVGAHRFGVPFPKLQTFFEVFWALHTYDYYSQYEKTMLRILFTCLFMKLQQQK